MNKTTTDLWYKDDQFKNQFSTDYQKKQIENRWFIFKQLIQKHQFNKSKVLKVLDFGCGDGINILGIKKALDELNIEYIIKGVDFNIERLKKVKEKSHDVQTGRVDIVNDQLNEKFDLIIFNHVLEHIQQDDIAIKNLYSILNDDGLILLGVPNEGCFLAQLRNNILHRKILKYTDHVQFYTLKTLSQKLEKYFNIIDIFREGFFMPHERLAYEFKKYKIGQIVLRQMQSFFPSQSAGFILGLTKK